MHHGTKKKRHDCLTVKWAVKLGAGRSVRIYEYAKKELVRLIGKKYSGTIFLEFANIKMDGFKILSDDRSVTILGNNPRSLLFGVFSFLKYFAGYRWFYPGEEISDDISDKFVLPARIDFSEFPSFARRFIFPENIFFTFSLLKKIIDWAPRNMIGDITLSYNAWAKWGKKLTPEIYKRDLSVTLSGHCLNLFIPKEEIHIHPDWFALIDGQRINFGQYCYSNPQFQKRLAEKLISFLSQDGVVKRMSIWAEDSAVICQCRNCTNMGFLKSFAECVDNVAKLVRKKYPDIEIAFLAYNAGLAWEMLEPITDLNLQYCGMEFAYWGRDYRYGLGDNKIESDQRALKSLMRWRQTNKGDIALLEYYTDLWMFSRFIPPMVMRIADDCKKYAKLGFESMGSLMCFVADIFQTKHKKSRDEDAPLFFPNLYFFAALAWNSQLTAKSVLYDFVKYRYGKDAQLCMQYMIEMEKLLLKISSYNRKLFRLRFVDIWYRDIAQSEGGTKFSPEEWNPKILWTSIEKRRLKDCEKMVRAMEFFQNEHGWKITEKNNMYRMRVLSFKKEWMAILYRFNAILVQLRAQQAIYNSNALLAIKLLKKALSLRQGISTFEKQKCRQWIAELETVYPQ